jgi:hypothetical protein
LGEYVNGVLPLEDLVLWADTLEGRDDVELDDGCREDLAEFLFVVTVPEANGPFTLEVATTWQDRFEQYR